MSLTVGNIIAVTYRSLWAGQRILLTLTYRVKTTNSSQDDLTDLGALATSFSSVAAGSLLTAYRECLPPNVQVEQVYVQKIHPVRTIAAISSPDVPGTDVENALTGNIAAVITLRTNLAGRSQVGNKHIGPVGSDRFAAGEPTAGYVDLLNTLAQEMLSDQVAVPAIGEGVTVEPIIFHRALGTNDKVTNYAVSDRIGTMRRRTVRVGE